MSATGSAARASAWRRIAHAGCHWPSLTQTNPTITANELQMSVSKCRASASRAWLLCLRAACPKARERE